MGNVTGYSTPDLAATPSAQPTSDFAERPRLSLDEFKMVAANSEIIVPEAQPAAGIGTSFDNARLNKGQTPVVAGMKPPSGHRVNNRHFDTV
jgi:hypothetical protein